MPDCTQAGPQAPEHPCLSSLSLEAWDRMRHDHRVLSGEWSIEDWCWEEIKQLNAALKLLKSVRRG